MDTKPSSLSRLPSARGATAARAALLALAWMAAGAARADVHLNLETAPALKAGATAADVRAAWGRPALAQRYAFSGLGLLRYEVPGGQSVVEVDLDAAERVTAVRTVAVLLP